LVEEGALIDPDELDKAAVPVADPAAVEFVEPLVANPVVAVPMPTAEVDVDAVGVLVEADVVPLPELVVVVVLIDVPVVVPCMVPGVTVWAWSAVAPSRLRATARVLALDRRDVTGMPRRVPSRAFLNVGARLCFICLSCLVKIGKATAPCSSLKTTTTARGRRFPGGGRRPLGEDQLFG
jgi:hypothetical protein